MPRATIYFFLFLFFGIMSGLYHFSKSVSLSIKQKQKEHLLHKDLNMVN
jgi:hypothetical protein